MRLNLGSGEDYMEGFTNLDLDSRCKPDVVADLNEPLPFKKNTFDYILAKDTICYAKDFVKLMQELHRVSKAGGIIEIKTSHFSGTYGRKYPAFYQELGIGSFDVFQKNDCLQLGVKVIEQRLHLFTKPSKLDWFFNFNLKWKRIMERIFFIGFNSINFALEVEK